MNELVKNIIFNALCKKTNRYIKIYQNIGRDNSVFPKLWLWLVHIVPMQTNTLALCVCGPKQKCCHTRQGYSRSRCSQKCSCRSCSDDMPNFLSLLSIQPLLGLFTSRVVLSNQVGSSLMWTPRYLKLLTLSMLTLSTSSSQMYSKRWGLLFFLMSTITSFILSMLSVVVLSPWHQTDHLPPVGHFIPTSDASYHCSVICKL